MTTKELIRAEIERLKSKYRHNGLWTSSFQSDLAMAKIESMNELLPFLNTLPDEPVMGCKDLTEAAEEYADYNSRRWQEDGDIYYDHSKIKDAFKAGAEWGEEHFRDATKMVDKSMEEAAEHYATPFNDTTYGVEYSFKGFKAGAEWQSKKAQETIKTAEDHAFFAGQEKFRENLLEWAKEIKRQAEELRKEDYGDVFYGAQIALIDEVINKLNSL